MVNACGWIVGPENPRQLAETIQYVVDHTIEADEVGWKAREKCKQKYSWDTMEENLMKIFENIKEICIV